MSKKSIIFLLIFTLLVGLLTGCVASTSKQGEVANSSQNATTGNDVAAKKQDFGTVKIIMGDGYSKGTEVEKVAEHIKEKSGVKIEPVYSDGTTDKFTLMIAASEDIDMVMASPINFNTYVKNGSIMSIDGLLEKYGHNLKRMVYANLWGWCKIDGKTYAVPNESTLVPYTVQIRKDWLSKLSVPTPQTMDEFRNIMIRFKDEYNTNPLLMETGFEQSIAGSYLPMGYSWWKSNDGTYLPPEMHPEYVDLLKEMNSWYKEGIIHPENFSGSHTQLIEANKIGAKIGWYSRTFNACFNLIKQVPEAEYENIQPMKGKYDNGYISNDVPNSYRVINVNSKNPEGVIVLLDWIAAELENTIISRLGIEGEHWEYINKQKAVVRNLTKGNDDTRFIPGTFEFLDISGYSERQDTTNNPRIQWYYNWGDIISEGKVRKTYAPLDFQLFIADGNLKSADVMNDVNTALEEAKIGFITGTRNFNEWDSFIKEWKKIGMQKIIDEKNVIYKEKNK